jgi:hypothetical protein
MAEDRPSRWAGLTHWREAVPGKLARYVREDLKDDPDAPEQVRQATAQARQLYGEAQQQDMRGYGQWQQAQAAAQDAAERGCEFCGQATTLADGVHQLGSPWRRCRSCERIAKANSEVSFRRWAFAQSLLGDLSEPTGAMRRACENLRYFCEQDGALPDAAGTEQRWEFADVKCLRGQILDTHRWLTQKVRSRHGSCCGGCGVLLAVDWAEDAVPVTRRGHEQPDKLPMCPDCWPLWVKGGSDPHSTAWSDWLCADALRLRTCGQGLAERFHFMPYHQAWPDDHDFTRRFGWIAEADLTAAHDLIVRETPGYAQSPEETAQVRRRQQMERLRQSAEYVPPPPPTFSVR